MLSIFFAFLAIISIVFAWGSSVIGLLYGVYLVMQGSSFLAALFSGGLMFIGVLAISLLSYFISAALAITFKD